MADDENTEVEEQPKQVEESGGVLDLNSALQQVLKKAAVQPEGLARGLREAVKALDRKVAHLCILAQDCDSAEYVRLVEALAQEHSIPIIMCPMASSWASGSVSARSTARATPRRWSSARAPWCVTGASPPRPRPFCRTTSPSRAKCVCHGPGIKCQLVLKFGKDVPTAKFHSLHARSET